MHSVTVFIERFRAAVSLHIGPCCPALLELCSCKCAYCCVIEQIKLMMMMMTMRAVHWTPSKSHSYSFISTTVDKRQLCHRDGDRTENKFNVTYINNRILELEQLH